MKKLLIVVLAGCLALGIMACGAKEVSDDGAGASTETVQSTSLTEGSRDATAGDETQTDSQFSEVPSSYNGAYSDGSNYLVIANGGITVNGSKCEVTKIQTDLFESGVPVVYFTYEGSESSIYCDEYGMSCSIGCEEGSWMGFNTIDIAKVPNFDANDSSMAHYMPDVFPYHNSDADCVSHAMVNGELDFFVVMYKEYYGEIFAKSVEYSDYAGKYGNGDLDECFENGYKFYTNFGLDESKVGDFSDWADVFTEIRVTKEYEVQNVIWYLDDGDGHFTTYSKMVGDDVIIDYICEDVDSRGYQRFPGIVYGAYYMNVEMGELHKEDYGKGLGLVEYDDCIVYYSK